jgi:hypothetical protein
VEHRITFEEYGNNLPEILDRTEHHGERFIVEDEGRVVAKLGYPNEERLMTWKAFVHLYFALPRSGAEFSDDLQEIHAMRGYTEPFAWPD